MEVMVFGRVVVGPQRPRRVVGSQTDLPLRLAATKLVAGAFYKGIHSEAETVQGVIRSKCLAHECDIVAGD